jgi:hypothetical protein
VGWPSGRICAALEKLRVTKTTDTAPIAVGLQHALPERLLMQSFHRDARRVAALALLMRRLPSSRAAGQQTRSPPPSVLAAEKCRRLAAGILEPGLGL